MSAINKVDYTSAIEALEAAYNLNWFPTNFGATGAPQLPAGMVIPILGFPYIVEGGDVLPSGSPSDALVFIKITPNFADGGLTADAAFTNTFSGSWNGAYNGWYDGNSFFLNFFCTKAGANYNGKGFWLNWRERKLAVISDSLDEVKTSGAVVAAGRVTSLCRYGSSVHATKTDAEIFAILAPLIPNVGDKASVNLKRLKTTKIYNDITFIERHSATEIYAFGIYVEFDVTLNVIYQGISITSTGATSYFWTGSW